MELKKRPLVLRWGLGAGGGISSVYLSHQGLDNVWVLIFATLVRHLQRHHGRPGPEEASSFGKHFRGSEEIFGVEGESWGVREREEGSLRSTNVIDGTMRNYERM